MKPFYESVMQLIKDTVDKQFAGNVAKASMAWGVTSDNLYKWLRGDRIPTLEKIGPVLDALAISSQGVTDASQDVCFVNAQLVQATDGVAPPQAVDYIAAPMVGEVGAGLGYIPQDEVKSWFLVYKNLDAVRYRRNLIAVQIGKNSTSMQPLLNPLDIVLVDRDDRDVTSPGHIMLVKDSDGSGMIKRVSVDETKNGDFSVVYYSDNATKNPPICYSLKTDFLGEWDNAIVGRVIWAWSDVREK